MSSDEEKQKAFAELQQKIAELEAVLEQGPGGPARSRKGGTDEKTQKE